MVNTEYLWNRRAAIQLRALMNRIYYQERQRIFEMREGLVKVIAILGGSLAFANIADPVVVQWSAAIISEFCRCAGLRLWREGARQCQA